MRKGQEEMTGFALIVVIVAMVGVFFLVFALKKDINTDYQSVEVQQFLDSALIVQTPCTIEGSQYSLRVDGLIQSCYSNKADKCTNGKQVCEFLSDLIKEIVVNGWNINPKSYYTGYKLSMTFQPSDSAGKGEEVVKLEGGNCTSGYFGGEAITPERNNRGNIITKMSVCSAGKA